MAEDEKQGRLSQDIYSYRAGKDGKVFIYWEGRQIMILKDKAATRFLARIEGLSGEAAQLVLAKVTGNFKHGNERTAQQHQDTEFND